MKPTVLIGEHSIPTAQSIANVFREAGYEVAGIHHDGVGLVTQATEAPPTILALDLLLPRLGGLQVVAALARQNIEPRVVVISGVSSRERIQDAKAAGVAYYMLKPIDLEKLAEVAARLVEATRVAVAGG